MNERIAHQLVRFRYLFALASLLLLGFLLIGTKNLYFESSYRIFFDADNPQLLAHDDIENTYTKSDNVMFVFELADEKVFTRETLQILIDFTEEAWTLPFSSRVDSITNFQYTWGVEDDLIVEDLVQDPAQLSDRQLAEKQALAVQEPQLRNLLISERAHTTAVLVTLLMPDDQREADVATLEVSAHAKALAVKYEQRSDNIVKIHLTGETIVNATFNEMSQQDMQTLFPAMFGLIVLFLVVMLRSVTGMLATLVVIILSVLATQGFTGWVGYALNQVNVACPIIVLTLAVCDCVHILNSYFYNLNAGMTKREATQESLRTNLQPVFLTSITTAVGFLSMNFSDSPPFWGLGNIAAFGVMAAMLFSLTVLPALMVLLPFKARSSQLRQGRLVVALGERVIARQNPVLIGLLCVGLGLASLMGLNELNDDTVAYFHEDVPFRQAADFTQENLTGFDQLAYSLKTGESNGVADPEFLRKAESFVNWYKAQPEVIQVSSYTNIHKRLNKNMHGDDEAYYRLPDDRELSAQYLLLYELSLPFGLDLNNQIDLDKSSMLIRVRVKDQKAKQLIALDERAQAWMRENIPELATNGASIALMFAHIGDRNIDSMIVGSLAALVLVTLTLIMALKSVKYGILSLIPNGFPAAMTFGLWAIFNGEVNLAVAVIFAITLGIVVDDTVHYMSKYLRGMREHGYGPEKACHYAFEQVGNALLTTTVVLAVGFFILSTSSFDVNAVLGMLVAITIIIALLWDLLLLPVLLIKAEKWWPQFGRGQPVTTV